MAQDSRCSAANVFVESWIFVASSSFRVHGLKRSFMFTLGVVQVGIKLQILGSLPLSSLHHNPSLMVTWWILDGVDFGIRIHSVGDYCRWKKSQTTTFDVFETLEKMG